MQGENCEDNGFLVGTLGWTFAKRAFILPVVNWIEISTSNMEKQDSACDVPVLR